MMESVNPCTRILYSPLDDPDAASKQDEMKAYDRNSGFCTQLPSLR